LNTINAIKIKALAFSYTEKRHLYLSLAKAFNDYSKQYGLDIELDLELLTPENSTSETVSIISSMDSLLKKRSDKYDIYVYPGPYAIRFSNHLIDLKKYISDEHLNLYSEKILYNGNDVLTGMPLNIDVSSLYSNQILLNKYGKQIPKTWDELIDTAQYILQKEKEEDPDSDLVGYNGHINYDSSIPSLYEFTHSFRDSNDSPHPPLKSQQTIDAFQKLKNIKEKISSDSIFRSSDAFTIEKIFAGGALFLRFWYLDHIPLYTTSSLPGEKAGVSGTIGLANNIGICKYINEENIKAAAEVIKFISSKDVQKEYVIKNHFMSAILSLYDDEEVCSYVDCGVIKGAMPLYSMEFTKDGFGSDDFNIQFKQYVFDFLFKNGTAKEMVEKIDSITTIHNFSLQTDDTTSGLVVFILITTTLSIFLLSTIFLFIKAFEKQYKFLSKDFWIISILGSVMIMSAIFTLYGNVTKLKCYLRLVYTYCGVYLCFLPILCKLIINIPLVNPCSVWVKNHQYLFLLLMLLVEIIINVSWLFIPLYKIEKIDIPDGKNFEKCSTKKGFGLVIYYFEVAWIIIVLICNLFLIFIEWNLKVTLYELRFFTASIFISFFFLIMCILVSEIKIKNYIEYSIFQACILYILSLSNHFFIYDIRIIQPLIKNRKKEMRSKFYDDMKCQEGKSFSNTFGCTVENSDIMKTERMTECYQEESSLSTSIRKPPSEQRKLSIVSNTIEKNNILRLHYTETFGSSKV